MMFNVRVINTTEGLFFEVWHGEEFVIQLPDCECMFPHGGKMYMMKTAINDDDKIVIYEMVQVPTSTEEITD